MKNHSTKILSVAVLFGLVLYSQARRLVEPSREIEREIKHTEDTPKITTAPISHIEIQTCRYCPLGDVDSILQFIRYDLPHYENKVRVTYKSK